jgi:hypothetical protein
MNYPCCRTANTDGVNMGKPYGNKKTIISTYEIAMFAKTQTQMTKLGKPYGNKKTIITTYEKN